MRYRQISAERYELTRESYLSSATSVLSIPALDICIVISSLNHS